MKKEIVEYKKLNARQKELRNFHVLAALLSSYGYSCLWLTDDWQGADFIANHIDGESFLRIQLKARLTLDNKYIGKKLHLAFPIDEQWYVAAHDELIRIISDVSDFEASPSWSEKGWYNWPKVPSNIVTVLNSFCIGSVHISSPKSRINTVNCPGCGVEQPLRARYPDYFCASCMNSVTDAENEPIVFYNPLPIGKGCAAAYKKNRRLKYRTNQCYINEIECRALGVL